MGPYSVRENQPTFRRFSVDNGAVASDAAAAQHAPFCLTEQLSGVASCDHAALIQQINLGLPVVSLELMQQSMQVAQKVLSEVLGISTTTLARRKQEGQKLTAAESDRAVRLARLWDSAVEVMGGDTQKAGIWWQAPQDMFDSLSPIQHAKTSVGWQDVDDLIGRLRHGVFS